MTYHRATIRVFLYFDARFVENSRNRLQRPWRTIVKNCVDAYPSVDVVIFEILWTIIAVYAHEYYY